MFEGFINKFREANRVAKVVVDRDRMLVAWLGVSFNDIGIGLGWRMFSGWLMLFINKFCFLLFVSLAAQLIV